MGSSDAECHGHRRGSLEGKLLLQQLRFEWQRTLARMCLSIQEPLPLMVNRVLAETQSSPRIDRRAAAGRTRFMPLPMSQCLPTEEQAGGSRLRSQSHSSGIDSLMSILQKVSRRGAGL